MLPPPDQMVSEHIVLSREDDSRICRTRPFTKPSQSPLSSIVRVLLQGIAFLHTCIILNLNSTKEHIFLDSLPHSIIRGVAIFIFLKFSLFGRLNSIVCELLSMSIPFD
jgi:hypothetical protein